MDESKKLEWDTSLDVSREQISENIDDFSMKKQQSIRYRQDTKYRCIFSWWVIAVVSVWLMAVILIVFLQATLTIYLKTAEFVTLLGTTTANVLGLSYIVLKGMFPKPK